MEAIKGTGQAYNEIGRLFDEQPKQDWEPLGDMLHIYKGVISMFPDIFTNHKVRSSRSSLLNKYIGYINILYFFLECITKKTRK